MVATKFLQLLKKHPSKMFRADAKAQVSYDYDTGRMTNGIVLDPFLGSGSTLIACEETDRVCRGIELDPKFVDVIVKRYIEHSEGHYDDVYVIRDSQKLKFEEVATFEPEREVADGE